MRVARPRLVGEHSGVTGFPDGFSVRRATAADLGDFGRFSRQTFVETYREFHSAEKMARHVAERLDDGTLAAELSDPARIVLMLTHGDAWAGYAVLRRDEAPPEVVARRPVEVERFYVDAQWHGQRLAAPLMTAALDAARQGEHDVAWLGVWERNPRAIRFYEKQGFRIVGHHIYLFDGHPENDHLMSIGL